MDKLDAGDWLLAAIGVGLFILMVLWGLAW